MPKHKRRSHFDRRVLRLFRDEGLYLTRVDHSKFLSYVRQFYIGDEDIPRVALRQLVANFLQSDLQTAEHFFVPPVLGQKRKRSMSRKGSLISILGRHEPKRFAIQCADGSPEAKRVKKFINKSNPSLEFRATELSMRSPDRNNIPRLQGPNNTPYKLAMQSTKATLFVEETPDKKHSNHDVTIGKAFDTDFIRSFFEDKKDTSTFSFIVTPNGIDEREHLARPFSQKKAMGGYSAAEIFKRLGVNFNPRMARYFHLAHRQGWAMGGDQSKENLDPATAGSNYTTLFYIESTIKYLLKDKDVSEIEVIGNIVFHESVPGLPVKITYTCKWENGAFSKDIYPLNPRRPTISEYNASKVMVEAEHEDSIGRKLEF